MSNNAVIIYLVALILLLVVNKALSSSRKREKMAQYDLDYGRFYKCYWNNHNCIEHIDEDGEFLNIIYRNDKNELVNVDVLYDFVYTTDKDLIGTYDFDTKRSQKRAIVYK